MLAGRGNASGRLSSPVLHGILAPQLTYRDSKRLQSPQTQVANGLKMCGECDLRDFRALAGGERMVTI